MDVLSNNSDVTFTPDQLRKLAEVSGSREATPPPVPFRVHQLSKRLNTEQIDEVVQRYEAGASAGSLARDLGIATSALLRLLRERNVVVRRRLVTVEMEQSMAREYVAGMTVTELESKHELSHNAVLRALHRSGVEMRGTGRRPKPS